MWFFPTKPKIFLANPNDNLKNRCHFKLTPDHEGFQLLFELNFFCKSSLLLKNSITS